MKKIGSAILATLVVASAYIGLCPDSAEAARYRRSRHQPASYHTRYRGGDSDGRYSMWVRGRGYSRPAEDYRGYSRRYRGRPGGYRVYEYHYESYPRY
jgi:hypothetical protein